MIRNTPLATFGNTIRSALICASLLCGLSFTIYAAGNDDDHGQGNGRGQGNGNGHGHGNKNVTSINIVPAITSLTLKNGELVASGVVSAIVDGNPVFAGFADVPVTVTATPAGGAGLAAAAACPILSLALAPIHLNLLGLVLDTSPICANVTANSGAGLLGDLLCTLANGLVLGTNLSQVLTSLIAADLQNLLLGLTAILNGTLANLLDALATSVTPAATGNCSLLNLSLGPINLNILGLAVAVDNCAGGAAAVALSGQPGTLLGNLTCSLVGGSGILSGILGGTLSLAGVINQLLGLLG